MIAAVPVHAALRRIGQHAFRLRGLPDFFRNIVRLQEGFARGFVPQEFYSEQKSEPSNISDVRVFFERSKGCAQIFPRWVHAFKMTMPFLIISDRVALW